MTPTEPLRTALIALCVPSTQSSHRSVAATARAMDGLDMRPLNDGLDMPSQALLKSLQDVRLEATIITAEWQRGLQGQDLQNALVPHVPVLRRLGAEIERGLTFCRTSLWQFLTPMPCCLLDLPTTAAARSRLDARKAHVRSWRIAMEDLILRVRDARSGLNASISIYREAVAGHVGGAEGIRAAMASAVAARNAMDCSLSIESLVRPTSWSHPLTREQMDLWQIVKVIAELTVTWRTAHDLDRFVNTCFGLSAGLASLIVLRTPAGLRVPHEDFMACCHCASQLCVRCLSATHD